MPLYRGGLTGLAGTLSGIEEGGGRAVNEVMKSYDYNRLLNKEQVEEDRRLKKELREQKYKSLDIAMNFYEKALKSDDHETKQQGVKLYNEHIRNKVKGMFGIELSEVKDITKKEAIDFYEIKKFLGNPEAQQAYLMKLQAEKSPHYAQVKEYFTSREADIEEEKIKAERQKKEQKQITGLLKYGAATGKILATPTREAELAFEGLSDMSISALEKEVLKDKTEPKQTSEEKAREAGMIEAEKQKAKDKVTDTASIRNYNNSINQQIDEYIEEKGIQLRPEYEALRKKNPYKIALMLKIPDVIKYDDWRIEKSNNVGDAIVEALTGRTNKNPKTGVTQIFTFDEKGNMSGVNK